MISALVIAPVLAIVPAKIRLEAFDYRDVSLLGGPLGKQAAEAQKFYLALDEDSLLQGFRLRADLPAPGKPMGGWYDPEGFAGAHPFGQYVSALARMFAVTGNQAYRQKVGRLVHGFNLTIASDGFFYSSQKVFKNWPCYLYDKNCIGMRDAYTLTGNQEALKVLGRMTDWAVKNLPRRSDEWYTLSENLLSCYELTKEKRYLDMAREFDYSTGFYDSFAAGNNAFKPTNHAYSHVNTLASSAKSYEVSGEEKYLHATENAWKWLTETQMFATGGWGPNERFIEPGKGKLAQAMMTVANGSEIPCGAYANVNLDRYLLRFTGNPKYGDNMERVLYNGMLAALPPLSDGHTFYYMDLRPGAKKIRRDETWTCCSGTYAQITADYSRDIYFHDSKDLTVNLFAPSTLNWRRNGISVKVAQSTDYPEHLRTHLVVSPSRTTRFDVNIRVPAWTDPAPIVRINNVPLEAKVSHGMLSLARDWHKGDKVDVTFPTKLRFEAIDPQTPNQVALMNGPILLVALAKGDVPLSGNSLSPSSWISLKRGGTDYETTDHRVTFRPFYLVGEETYTAYCNLH